MCVCVCLCVLIFEYTCMCALKWFGGGGICMWWYIHDHVINTDPELGRSLRHMIKHANPARGCLLIFLAMMASF